MKWIKMNESTRYDPWRGDDINDYVMEILAKFTNDIPTDEEFFRGNCLKFLDVDIVDGHMEYNTVEGKWSSENTYPHLHKYDGFTQASLSCFHKNELHVINGPDTWVFYFNESATWEDVVEAAVHFTHDVVPELSEEVKEEILHALRGKAVTQHAIESLIPVMKKYGGKDIFVRSAG